MSKTQKLDLYKEHKEEYVTPKTPKLVEIGAVPYLAIDGKGAPEGELFTSTIQAMYGMAFTIKMTRKFAGRDYKVCHLEGLWCTDAKVRDFFEAPRDEWYWKLLIRIPDFIGEGDLEKAKQALLDKGKGPRVKQVNLETIEEGLCVQMLHVGPYSDEAATVETMRRFAEENSLSFHGRHHEIYLSDPRRVPPQRLRTILRHPVRSR